MCVCGGGGGGGGGLIQLQALIQVRSAKPVRFVQWYMPALLRRQPVFSLRGVPMA